MLAYLNGDKEDPTTKHNTLTKIKIQKLSNS